MKVKSCYDWENNNEYEEIDKEKKNLFTLGITEVADKQFDIR